MTKESNEYEKNFALCSCGKGHCFPRLINKFWIKNGAEMVKEKNSELAKLYSSLTQCINEHLGASSNLSRNDALLIIASVLSDTVIMMYTKEEEIKNYFQDLLKKTLINAQTLAKYEAEKGKI